MEATFDGADECPVVSFVTTKKLCIPTDRTGVMNVPAAPVTVPIIGGVAASSKMVALAIWSGVSGVPSVRVVGGVQVKVAVDIVKLLVTLRLRIADGLAHMPKIRHMRYRINCPVLMIYSTT